MNRPERVARVFQGDPDAMKRRDVRNAECYVTQTRHAVLYSDYVYNGIEVIPHEADTTGYGLPCNSTRTAEYFIDGLRSLLLMAQHGIELYSIGDICASDPAILYLTDKLATDLPRYGAVPPNAAPMGGAHYNDLPYKLYVPSGTDGTLPNRFINPVEFGLLATRNVIKAQCPRMPARVRVYAATVDRHTGPRRRPLLQPLPPENLEVWQYYSGSFDPDRVEERLKHDDTQLAATYASYASARLAWVEAEPERQKKKQDSLAWGGFFAVILILVAQSATDPCNDPWIPHHEKVTAGCFDMETPD